MPSNILCKDSCTSQLNGTAGRGCSMVGSMVGSGRRAVGRGVGVGVGWCILCSGGHQ